MDCRIFRCILLVQAAVILVFLTIETFYIKPTRSDFHVRQESRTSPKKTRIQFSSVATVTDNTEPRTASDPVKLSSASTNTESNPAKLSSLSANTVTDPDKDLSLSVNTASGHGKLPSMSVNTASGHGKLPSMSVNTASGHGKLPSMSVSTDSDPDKLLSPYLVNMSDVKAYKAKKDKGKHPFVLTPQTKLILMWQDEQDTGKKLDSFRSACAAPTVGPCEMTTDLSYRSRADAVVIHASRLFSPTLPFPKLPGQIWIARGLESPVHWYSPYRSPQWRGVFNWTITYRPDSELFSPIGQLVKMPEQDLDYRKIAMSKKRSVAWFVSDCSTKSKREDYVNEMRKYIDVDIYGECGKLKCSKNDRGGCFELLSSTYRFYLSFENSLCNYYITEKFFNKLGNIGHRYHVIPVVRGGTNYRKYFPEGTFIDAADFQSPKALAMYLNKLGNDVDAYAALLRRKDQFGHYSCIRGQVWCNMCDMLHNPNIPPKVYDDIGAWWDQAACVEPTDI